ncbi:glycosyltransferase family 2 protein [Psychrobacter alimentarius]|uniref:glycosyltransferase family 2 protein n=1 Tax=Psychrobacter alimentarius TaxID=261164 RepID=UPI003FD4C84D
MNKSVFVTICIPFYNAEHTLLDAVRSVFAQTHESWELILIDDGSTDSSLKIAKSIKDSRVTVYSDGKNRRLAARLNELTKLAKYDVIARMDADDLMSTVRLEKQLKILLSNPNIDLVSTGLCSLNDKNEALSTRCVISEHSITSKGLLSGNSGIVHASLLGNRAWFKRNPYKESMTKSQDTNLWVRSYSKNDLNIAFIPEPLYYYREDGNVTQRQLLLAYAMGRHTIIVDAKNKFGLKLKSKALANNLVKTFFVRFFPDSAIKLARNRRNATLISKLEKKCVEDEIDYITRIDLPMVDFSGDSQID